MSDDQFWDSVFETVRNLDAYSYYQLLGIANDATNDEVRTAYFDLGRSIHPDRHALESDPARQRALSRAYARVGEAYRVLSDPTQRAAYDQGLAAGNKRVVAQQPRANASLRDARDPRSEHARQLLATGKQMLAEGDKRSARAQLELALQLEPQSPAINAAIEELGRVAPRRAPKPSPAPPPANEPAPSRVSATEPTPAQPAAESPPSSTLSADDLFGDSGGDDRGAEALEFEDPRELRKRPMRR